MSTQVQTETRSLFKMGWIVLLALAVLATVGHLALAFFIPDETTLFLGWAAANAYAAVVLAVPFRRGERWAWYSTWITVILFASLIFFDSQVGGMYAIIGGLMAVCLLLTRGAFFGAR